MGERNFLSLARRALLANPTLWLFAAVFLTFFLLSPRFADPRNVVNFLIQAPSATIVATGMTFVLLTAGIDLYVGAIMFLTAAIVGKMAMSGCKWWRTDSSSSTPTSCLLHDHGVDHLPGSALPPAASKLGTSPLIAVGDTPHLCATAIQTMGNNDSAGHVDQPCRNHC